jgi:hypothetical protein
MQEEAAIGQPSPDELAMAEQQQQMMPQEGMAYGGNLFSIGGAMNYLKSKYPQMRAESLRKMAEVLEKRVIETKTDVRTKKLVGDITDKDYERVFPEFDSINSDRRFNNWVKAGLPRDIAFDISYPKPPKSFGQKELDRWNAKRVELPKNLREGLCIKTL